MDTADLGPAERERGRPRRIAYLGTPALAVPPLVALHDAGYEIPVVVSRADKRRGRGTALAASPVKEAALALGLPVSTDIDAVLDAGVDLAVVVAFGRLVRPHQLAAVEFVNLHFSLLPRWRGAAPVERAILAGDEETGVCLMRLEEGLDTGPIYDRTITAIGAGETLSELRSRLVALGTALLLDNLDRGLGTPVPQKGEPTYAAKLDPDELRLDFDRPAAELLRLVRLGSAWTTFRGARLKVLAARPGPLVTLAAGELSGPVVGAAAGTVELVTVKPEGKGPRPAREWVNGARLAPGDRLGAP